MGGHGRCFPSIQQDFFAIRSALQQPKPAAAQPGTGRFDHRQYCRDGDRRIKGIAALGQNLKSRLRRQRMGAGNRGQTRACQGIGREQE